MSLAFSQPEYLGPDLTSPLLASIVVHVFGNEPHDCRLWSGIGCAGADVVGSNILVDRGV